MRASTLRPCASGRSCEHRYALDNPGAWGALLRTMLALSEPHTLIFIAYGMAAFAESSSVAIVA